MYACPLAEGLQYKAITYRLFKPKQQESSQAADDIQDEPAQAPAQCDDVRVKVTYNGGICNGTEEFWPTEKFYVEVRTIKSNFCLYAYQF